MDNNFEMVAKTFQGLEDVLAEELRGLGAVNVEPGRRMVEFQGDLAMLYRANMCCRTALRILKPIYKFTASTPDQLYELAKEFDWTRVLSLDKTFSIDTVANSDEFTHSRYVTYRVKDAIVDYFADRFGPESRPRVRLQDADVRINVHIAGERITISLDSSGESLHKRGYRVAQTEAPINEVLAAGIILKSGWRGECDFVDPMCGSGTFLCEAAMIARGINPGVYRRHFAFESWPDFDGDIFDRIYNDESGERPFNFKIYGSDISPKAVAIARENLKSAGLAKDVELKVCPISQWKEAPSAEGVLITNPPYGERIGTDDMEGLYSTIGTVFKNVFKGWHCWVIGYRKEYFAKIGLSPSLKVALKNGALDCELREYVIFDGSYSDFRAEGGTIRREKTADTAPKARRTSDKEWRDGARRSGFGGKKGREPKRSGASRNLLAEKYKPKGKRFADSVKENQKTEPSENPLAAKRNVHALDSIINRKPNLPPQEGPLMRPRRGWKKN